MIGKEVIFRCGFFEYFVVAIMTSFGFVFAGIFILIHAIIPKGPAYAFWYHFLDRKMTAQFITSKLKKYSVETPLSMSSICTS